MMQTLLLPVFVKWKGGGGGGDLSIGVSTVTAERLTRVLTLSAILF